MSVCTCIVPSRFRAQSTTRPEGPSLMGWVDGRYIKSVLQFSSHLVGIYIKYIPTYTRNKKLSPTFLWVSKFDVKLGVVLKIFKITAGRWLFFCWSKSSFWISKASLNFLHTSRVYRYGVYLLRNVIKNSHQHCYWFQNFMSSLG